MLAGNSDLGRPSNGCIATAETREAWSGRQGTCVEGEFRGLCRRLCLLRGRVTHGLTPSSLARAGRNLPRLSEHTQTYTATCCGSGGSLARRPPWSSAAAASCRGRFEGGSSVSSTALPAASSACVHMHWNQGTGRCACCTGQGCLLRAQTDKGRMDTFGGYQQDGLAGEL